MMCYSVVDIFPIQSQYYFFFFGSLLNHNKMPTGYKVVIGQILICFSFPGEEILICPSSVTV